MPIADWWGRRNKSWFFRTSIDSTNTWELSPCREPETKEKVQNSPWVLTVCWMVRHSSQRMEVCCKKTIPNSSPTLQQPFKSHISVVKGLSWPVEHIQCKLDQNGFNRLLINAETTKSKVATLIRCLVEQLHCEDFKVSPELQKWTSNTCGISDLSHVLILL